MTENIDLSFTTKPKTDQLNYDDFTAGPINITITGVKVKPGADMQPVSIYFEGDNNKPWKPCKSMMRVLMKGWGANGKDYIGRSVTLYGDDEVTFGKHKVGGIRISHMSDIQEDLIIPLTIARSRREMYHVGVMKVNGPSFDTEQVKDLAKSAANLGMEKYKEHFESLDHECRDILTKSGDHENNKTSAIKADSENEI